MKCLLCGASGADLIASCKHEFHIRCILESKKFKLWGKCEKCKPRDADFSAIDWKKIICKKFNIHVSDDLNSEYEFYTRFCKRITEDNTSPLDEVFKWLLRFPQRVSGCGQIMRDIVEASMDNGDKRAFDLLFEEKKKNPNRDVITYKPGVNWTLLKQKKYVEIMYCIYVLRWYISLFDPVVDILKEGDYESFERLLGIYIAPKPEYLFTACKGVQGANEDGKLKIVELLIEKGVNVNHWLEDNVVSNSHYERICSFLIDPIRFGYKKLVDLLISKGITLTCDSMAVAIEKGDLGLIQLHRSSGVNYRYSSNKFFDNTSLALAYKNGSIDVAEYILNDEYDLGQDFDAINALICRNDRDKVELLLNLGTKVNYTRDRLDNSPIFIASTIGNFEIIKLLVEYGADCNIKDSNGKTVLHHLFQETYFRRYKHKLSQQEKIDIIDYFLNLGLDIDAVDNDGSTLLHCHCHGRDGTEILERLILRGAQINTPDRFGMTPLLQASKNGTIDAIKLLLRNGADLEARNCEGSNCYLVAIEGGNLFGCSQVHEIIF